ncbi:MAG TPA: dienelactone hydrolase family protein [Micromonosporaceae bacterium]|nr:dienelactone hydrolase family protein [Micromonosporaceae bacterium]
MHELHGFDRFAFTHDGLTRDVLRAGTGPGVVVMPELPGLHPPVLGFARRVVGIGCTAYLPSLFGTPGRANSLPYLLSSVSRVCIARELTVFAAGRTSPVVSWLRALAARAHEECGGPGVGAVGMCFTGGFALAMLVDDRMLAAVLSQPSLPVPLGRRRRADVGLSRTDLARIRERAAGEACVLGLRFTGDRAVPAERFATLRRELGAGFLAVEIDSSPGNRYGIPGHAHAVLTGYLGEGPDHPTRRALEQVLAFLRDQLQGPADKGSPRPATPAR